MTASGIDSSMSGSAGSRDDVPPLGLAELEGELVDHDPVVDVNGVEHRLRRDPEWLDQESLDDHGDRQRSEEETGQLGPEGAILLRLP